MGIRGIREKRKNDVKKTEKTNDWKRRFHNFLPLCSFARDYFLKTLQIIYVSNVLKSKH